MKTTVLLSASAIILTFALAGASIASPGARAASDVFETLDADNDGRITREEMAAKRAERIDALDADGNGFVTALELQDAAAQRARQRAERLIQRRDTDGDGQLSIEELGGADRAEARFDRVDRNGDGAITKAEFDAARDRRKQRGPAQD